MDINVRDNAGYKEVEIEADSTTISLGLLDAMEAKELAIALIRAAEELLS